MAIKDYTVEQLQGDLAAMARMFPNGIPPEQFDRLNAIKAELKRRNAEVVARPMSNERAGGPRAIENMSAEELQAELRALSVRLGNDPSDDEAQERFANVRYALKQRGATRPAPAAEPERMVPRQVETRALEIPDDVPEIQTRVGTSVTPSIPREQFEIGNIVAPNEVCGWTAQVGGKGIIFSHVARTEFSSIIQFNSAMSIENAEKFVAMIQAKIATAKALS